MLSLILPIPETKPLWRDWEERANICGHFNSCCAYRQGVKNPEKAEATDQKTHTARHSQPLLPLWYHLRTRWDILSMKR